MTAVELLKLINTQGFDENLQERVISLSEADLEQLESVIITAKIPRMAYEFALIKASRSGDIKKLQDLIIGSTDGGLMILFAADVDGADIELFEKAINDLPDAKYLQLFEAEMRQKGFY